MDWFLKSNFRGFMTNHSALQIQATLAPFTPTHALCSGPSAQPVALTILTIFSHSWHRIREDFGAQYCILPEASLTYRLQQLESNHWPDDKRMTDPQLSCLVCRVCKASKVSPGCILWGVYNIYNSADCGLYPPGWPLGFFFHKWRLLQGVWDSTF